MEALLNLLCSCLRRWRPNAQQVTPEGNPLPSTVHKQLSVNDLGPGRLIIVGDVHGCYDALLELLRKVQYRPQHDNLVLVGDLVDKGPKSQQVVAAVRAWCEGSYCWVVRGNHCDAALAARLFLEGGGAQDDLPPKFSWVHELLPEDVDFMVEMPFSLTIDGYHIVVVHAALIPDVPLQAQDLGVLIKVRDLIRTPEGSWIGLEEPQEGSQAWAGCWQGPGHVFFGHDAKRNLQEAPFATGLDTGCVYGRQLTACVLPPLRKPHAQQDAVPQSGRNGKQKGSSSAAAAGGQAAAGERELNAGAVPLTPSLQQLRGELHSVMGSFVYEKKGKKQKKDKAKKKVKFST